MAAREVALIVGGGPGISASCARLFAQEGMSVAVAARTPDKPVMLELEKDHGVRRYACDAADPSSSLAASAAASSAGGGGGPRTLRYTVKRCFKLKELTLLASAAHQTSSVRDDLDGADPADRSSDPGIPGDFVLLNRGLSLVVTCADAAQAPACVAAVAGAKRALAQGGEVRRRQRYRRRRQRQRQAGESGGGASAFGSNATGISLDSSSTGGGGSRWGTSVRTDDTGSTSVRRRSYKAKKGPDVLLV